VSVPPNPSPKEDIDETAAHLAGIEADDGKAALLLSADDQVKIGRAKSEDSVRTFVTMGVVGANIVLWVIAGAAYLFGSQAAPGVVDVIKVAMPVLTLILGYYFASSRR